MVITDRNSKNFSYLSQLGILIGLIGAGMIIGSIVSVIIWLMMTGRPILAMANDMLKPQYYNAVMTIQVVSTFFLFFLPVYFFALICYRKPAKFIGFNKNINYKQIFILFGILVLTFPLSGALAELNKVIPIPTTWATKFKVMESSRAAQEAALININSFPRYIVSLIVIALLPGLFEEVCFRAGIQNVFTRWFKGPWLAIIITSIVFSLGFVFSYSDNIWLSSLFHFLYNGLQVTALYAFTISGTKDQKDIEENFPLWAGVAALVLIIYLFIQFKKTSLLQRAKVKEDDFTEDDFDFNKWPTAQS
jgi:uncharacterized protein